MVKNFEFEEEKYKSCYRTRDAQMFLFSKCKKVKLISIILKAGSHRTDDAQFINIFQEKIKVLLH